MGSWMSWSLSLALIAGCSSRAAQTPALPCVEAAPPDRSPAERLDWMSGLWVTWAIGEKEDTLTTEQWCPGDGGALIGYSETRRGFRVVQSERMRIEADGDALVYIASPSGQATTAFRGTTRCGRPGEMDAGNCSRSCEAVFSNPTHDFPKQITYSRCTQNDLLVATISGDDDQRRASWSFRRADR
jgi:hypothetical protein